MKQFAPNPLADEAAKWLRQHNTHGIGYSVYTNINGSYTWQWNGMDVPHNRSGDDLVEFCIMCGWSPPTEEPPK